MALPSIKHFFLQNSSWATTVIFDSASTSGYEASLSTYNWSHTVTANSNRVLVVQVAIFASGSVSSITFGAQNFVNLAPATVANGIYRTETWYLIAPTAGTGTITVNLSASLTSIANAESYYNAHQTTPLETQATNTGTGATASVAITTITNLDTVLANLVTPTASGVISQVGQNPRTSANGALGSCLSDDYGDVTPAGAYTIGWTGLGALDTWAASIVAIKVPATAVIRAKIQNLLFMGVG